MPSDVLMNRHMAKLGMAPQIVSWSDGSLTIHEVSKFFSIPIAEAASKLNFLRKHIARGLDVCGSVLQRICKENGIARWPYRKVTAGKSVEEIIEEGLKEMAANPGAYKMAEKQPPTTPENTSVSPIATPLSPTEPDATIMNVGQPSPKRPARQQHEAAPIQKSTQRTASAAYTKNPAPGNNTSPHRVNQQSTLSPAAAPTPPKQKPASTMDDFKVGFPSKGLRRASTRWWGPVEKESATLTTAATTTTTTTTTTAAEDRDTEVESSVEGLGGVGEGGLPTASSLLMRTRRKACLRGRGAVAHAVTRGYGLQNLGAKDAATLRFVFGEFLPEHWAPAFPPVS